MNKKYSISLDLGVGSIGWAVIDENNILIKKGGKNYGELGYLIQPILH